MSSISTMVYYVLILSFLTLWCNARVTDQDWEDTRLASIRHAFGEELLNRFFGKRDCFSDHASCGPDNKTPCCSGKCVGVTFNGHAHVGGTCAPSPTTTTTPRPCVPKGGACDYTHFCCNRVCEPASFGGACGYGCVSPGQACP